MDAYITKSGLMINYKTIKEFFNKEFTKFLENYIVIHKTKYNTKKIKLYTILKTKTGTLYLILPRFALVNLIKSNYIKNIKVNLPIPNNIKDIEFNISLNENQTTITDYVLNELYNESNLKNGLCGGILDAGTGTGKTIMGIYLISKILLRSLVICPNNVVLEAWKDDLTKSCNDNLMKRVNFNDITKLKDINIILIQSAIKLTKSDLSNFGLVIYDEIHKYCTEKYHKIFELCQFKYILGLSATPKHRIDGFDKISHLWVGNIIETAKLDGYKNNLAKITGKVEVIRFDNKYPYKSIQYNDAGGVSTIKTIQHICEDPRRTSWILNSVLRLVKLDKCVYIFSEERNRTIKLNALIQKILKYDIRIIDRYNLNNDSKLIQSLSLIGNYSNADFELAKSDAKIIFTTYALLEAGANIPKQTSMIYDTPRKNGYIQIVGRIKRQNEKFNDIERIVIDFIDDKLFLRKQFETRKLAYDEHKFKIVDIDQSFIDNMIDYTELVKKYDNNIDEFNDINENFFIELNNMEDPDIDNQNYNLDHGFGHNLGDDDLLSDITNNNLNHDLNHNLGLDDNLNHDLYHNLDLDDNSLVDCL